MQRRKILDSFSIEGELLSAIFLTYNLDIEFFTEDFLRILLDIRSNPIQNINFVNETRNKLGDKEITVIVNKKDYVRELQKVAGNVYRLPETLGYRLLPANYKIFHPKLYVLVYKLKDITRARLVVSSANLTLEGMRHSAELFSVCELSIRNTEYINLFTEVLVFLELLAKHMGRRSGDFKIIGHIHTLLNECPKRNRSAAKFVHTLGNNSILEQIEAELDGEKPIRIRILSPFYEDDVQSPENIKQTLFGHIVAIDGNTVFSEVKSLDIYFAADKRSDKYISSLPINILSNLKENFPELRFYPMLNKEYVCTKRGQKEVNRFRHAKALLLETDKHAFILTGSANFSNRAMLVKGEHGNVEACILNKFRKKKAPDIFPEIESADLCEIVKDEEVENLDSITNESPLLFVTEAIYYIRKRELSIFFDFESEPKQEWKLRLNGIVLLTNRSVSDSTTEQGKLIVEKIAVNGHFLTLSVLDHPDIKIPIRFKGIELPEFELDYDHMLLLLSGRYSLSYVRKLQQLRRARGQRLGSSSVSDEIGIEKENMNDFFKALDGIRDGLERFSEDKFYDVRFEFVLRQVQELTKRIMKRYTNGQDSIAQMVFKLGEIIYVLKSVGPRLSFKHSRQKMSEVMAQIQKRFGELAKSQEGSIFKDYLRNLGEDQ